MALYCVVEKICLDLPRLQSLAITFWGIFELIIQESADEESDGKGRKK